MGNETVYSIYNADYLEYSAISSHNATKLNNSLSSKRKNKRPTFVFVTKNKMRNIIWFVYA